ncbi:MAG: methyl-accepting chemotaxis protein, partial [Haloplanus sp.]
MTVSQKPGQPASEFPLSFDRIIGRIGAPIFILDADHEVVLWNGGMEALTGSTEADARAADSVGEAWYQDGRRAKTLADKVLEAPQDAHRQFDVDRIDDGDYPEYRDRSTFTDTRGETRHIEFSASPLYEGDELVGVVELVKDRTEDVRRRQRVEALVEEVTDAMHAIQRGDLGARAEFAAAEYVDEELLTVVDALNEMGATLDGLVADVDEQTRELREITQEVADSATRMEEMADEQADRTEEVAGEVSNLSATIEEVASTADSVADTSRQARDHAEGGRELSQGARDAMSTVRESSRDVRADVDELSDTVDEIDAVIEVINDIADQTNLLALNANIEAARADRDSDGFAVVANEIKSLAQQAQEQAGEIESMIVDVQQRTDQTVDSLETTEDQIDDGVAEV